MAAIRIPNQWDPRPYQLPLWNALESGCKRAVAVWHRRSGKDDVALHWACRSAVLKPATYWHLLPQSNQARKAIWDAVDPHTGMRRIDWAFPKELRETTREQDMLIRFKNGATWQVIGSDNYNAIVGSPPYGVVYSEYMLSDPNAWAFVRPILRENGGWALFNGTPRGRNHLHGIYNLALSEPGWFGQLLTVKDTGAMTDEEVAKERRELAKERGDDEAENIVNQEYFCSWDAALPGAFYGKILAKLEKAGRITDVPYDPTLPVMTAWDIGVMDATAIWFLQQTRSGLVNWIDYYEASGAGADHYAKVIREKPYIYDGHLLPHDADHREWGNAATSRIGVLKNLGIRPCRVMPISSIDDGINALYGLLERSRFDAKNCERGLNALRNYQREWDDKLRTFKRTPRHDWASHGADAARTAAQGLRAPREQGNAGRPRYAVT